MDRRRFLTTTAAVAALRTWEHRTFALRACVRDLRGDHVLFSAHAVKAFKYFFMVFFLNANTKILYTY